MKNNDQIGSIGQEPYDVPSSQPNDNGNQSNDVLNWDKKDTSNRPHSRQKRCKYFEKFAIFFDIWPYSDRPSR